VKVYSVDVHIVGSQMFTNHMTIKGINDCLVAVRKLTTQPAESRYKKQNGSDGAAGCGGDETTQIHRLNHPELDEVQAPPHRYFSTFLATTAERIFNS